MYFLKCDNCECFNEIKGEYLVFCAKCGKKLNNNYPDWKKRNPDKSFDDYKQSVCTTEKQDILVTKQKNTGNSKKKIFFGVGIVLAIVLLFLLGNYGGKKIAAWVNQSSPDKVLVEIANEVNKMCPIMVDHLTRLDNAMALPDNVFQYNYTITVLKDSIADIYELKESLEPTFVNAVSTNPDMQYVRDNDITVNYYYKDMEGVYLFTISITPDKYKSLISF